MPEFFYHSGVQVQPTSSAPLGYGSTQPFVLVILVGGCIDWQETQGRLPRPRWVYQLELSLVLIQSQEFIMTKIAQIGTFHSPDKNDRMARKSPVLSVIFLCPLQKMLPVVFMLDNR